MTLDRRCFIFAGSAVLAALVSSRTNAQQDPVSVDDLAAILTDDQKFELMRLSMAALRLTLTLQQAIDDPSAIPQYAESSGRYFDMVDRVSKARSALVDALKENPSPIDLSPKLNQAIVSIGDRLANGGIEAGSALSKEFLSNLRLFLAATSKVSDNVDGWFCSIFPFSHFCS